MQCYKAIEKRHTWSINPDLVESELDRASPSYMQKNCSFLPHCIACSLLTATAYNKSLTLFFFHFPGRYITSQSLLWIGKFMILLTSDSPMQECFLQSVIFYSLVCWFSFFHKDTPLNRIFLSFMTLSTLSRDVLLCGYLLFRMKEALEFFKI